MDHSLKNTSNLSIENCSLPLVHGVALIIVNSLVGVFGTLGNLMVCVAVAKNPRLRRSSNCLLFSLAIADLIVTLVCEPLVVGILGKIIFLNDCAADLDLPYKILSRLSCSASVVHMAAISVDRFIAVVYPLRYKSIIDGYGLKILMITSWALPITVPILSAVIPASFPKAFLALGMFAISYVTVLLSYSLIVTSLVRHRKERNQLRARSSSDANQSRVEIRVASTLAIVIAVFTVSWFPLVATLFAAGKPLVKNQGIAHMWIRTLALSNSAMNFVIYGSRMHNFREAYALFGKKILGVLRPKCSRTRVYNFPLESISSA